MTDVGTGGSEHGSTPWTAPGTSAPQPQPAASPATSGVKGDTPAVLPVPPVAFRPMTVADILDGAFEVLRRRPREVLIVTAVFVVPLQVLSSIVFRDMVGSAALGIDTDAGGLFAVDTDAESPSTVWTFLLVALSACALALVAGAICILVSDWFRNRTRSPQVIIWATVRRSPALLVGVVVVHLLEAVGFLGLGVGAYVVMVYMHVVSPAIVAEGIGPFAAVKRSMKLTGSRAGLTFALPLLVGLVGAAIRFGVAAANQVVLELSPDAWHWVVSGASELLAELVAVPFTAAVAVLYYFDLRIRSEGLDIEERARVVLAG